MKSFLKMLLAVICGFILMGILSIFLLSGIAGALALSGKDDKPVVPRSAILKIDMSSMIFEEQASSLPQSVSFLKGEKGSVGILDAVMAVNKAADDDAIKLIYLKTDAANASLSHIEELREALSNFRKTGKPIISYMESPSTGSYYLASVADKVLMSSYAGSGPMIFGIGTQMFFLKDILDKFGVNVQLIRHGKYKSAGETFIKNKPSDENLEQTREMINSLWNTCSESIAESRHIDKDKFNRLIDNLSLVSSEDMLKYNLVDQLVTREELKEELSKTELNDKFDKSHLISLSSYIKTLDKTKGESLKNKIAIIYANGEIIDKEDNKQISGNRFARIISEVNADSSIKAVVLRVSSPGGSVLASDKIKTALDELAKDKLLVASYGSYAASGGYWISNNCSKIFSDKTTLTGSIGVFSIVPDLSGTAKDFLHIGVASVGSNKHSNMMSMMRTLDKDEINYMQRSVEDIYSKFVKTVAKGRGLREEYVDSIAQGRVWSGTDALRLGLVDEIGTLETAVKYAASEIGEDTNDISGLNIVSYPEQINEFQALIDLFDKTGIDEDVLAKTPFKSLIYAFKNCYNENTNKVLARMPFEYIIR